MKHIKLLGLGLLLWFFTFIPNAAAANWGSCPEVFYYDSSSCSNTYLNNSTGATWTATATGCGTSSATASTSYSGASRELTWYSMGLSGGTWTYFGSSGTQVVTSIVNATTGSKSSSTYSQLQSVIWGYRLPGSTVDQAQADVTL